MIKHQVRPGLTGWAQVNGYRGDTSIRKRIECDLYYIENWTLGLDFKIILLTISERLYQQKRILRRRRIYVSQKRANIACSREND